MAHGMMSLGFGQKYSLHCADNDVGVCICSHTITIVLFLARLVFGVMSKDKMLLIAVISAAIPAFYTAFNYSDKFNLSLYQQMHKRYKKERHRTLRVWLVCLFLSTQQ